MENPDVLLQAFRQLHSMEVNTDVSSDQQPEQQNVTQLDSFEGPLEPKIAPPTLALIEPRIQQLQNRRFLLLKLQNLRVKKNDNSDGPTEELTSEDSDKLCELEAIQRELEVLQVQMEELRKQDKSSKSSNGTSWTTIPLSQQETSPTIHYTRKPLGGVYMLPPLQRTQEDITPATERPTGPVVPVDSLGQMAAVTQCPSCHEVVFTETHEKVGEAVWTLSCFCIMFGCIAGCCLIPFFMNRLRNVPHKCPNCQAHIHTYRPI
ncbi:uncharacterized protein LOC132955402 [Labrus mixtus]|uniref:uncharacterized protein LOC132955402 n=1 Tax=Labrus mixtus TaxID=508554 RepID=UPI0029BFADB4|nr:uncharacterized protein LOC132955402 [Labrus mixtus]